MSRSYWLPAIAFGLILTTGQAAQVKHAVRANGDTAQAQSQPVNAMPPVSLTTINSNTNRVAKALEAQNAREGSAEEDKRARENLEAQQKMANAASATVVVASVEAFITLVGVGLVGWTLYHTRRAADAARDAVTEAKEATKIANKTLAQSEEQTGRELRAYLSVEPAGIYQLHNPASEAIGQVIVRNVGKLPAQNVHVVVRMSLGKSRNYAPDTISDVLDIQRTIQPGAEMRQGTKDKYTIDDVRAADSYSYVWGTAWYSDGYGKRRYTRFCHRYSGASHLRVGGTWTGAPPIALPQGTIIEASKARYHETGNDSD